MGERGDGWHIISGVDNKRLCDRGDQVIADEFETSKLTGKSKDRVTLIDKGRNVGGAALRTFCICTQVIRDDHGIYARQTS
jgi:hypothetical protein